MVEKRDLDEWAGKSLSILKEQGYLKEKVLEEKTNYNFIWILITVILGLLLIGSLVFIASKGYFKSEVNQEVELKPVYNASITSIDNNKYNFTIIAENNYTFIVNIENKITIPE